MCAKNTSCQSWATKLLQVVAKNTLLTMLGADDADGATVTALLLLASCQMVLHLSQDLKHLLSRYTNTLTCTVHNKAEFKYACAHVKEAFTIFCPVRDGLLKARLRTRCTEAGSTDQDGVWPGGRLMLREAEGNRPAVMHSFKLGDLLGEGALRDYPFESIPFAKACADNRKPMSVDVGHTRLVLQAHRTQILDDPDFGVAWTRDGSGGIPVHTYCQESAKRLADILTNLKHMNTTLARSRTRSTPDGRGFPVEICIHGTNLTEAVNGLHETALSSHCGYKPEVAHNALMKVSAVKNITARTLHPDPRGLVETDLKTHEMQTVRTNNQARRSSLPPHHHPTTQPPTHSPPTSPAQRPLRHGARA